MGEDMKGKKMTLEERKVKIEGDSIERRKVFKELVCHIQAGYSLNCFGPLSPDAIRKYLKVYPKEFIEEELQAAMRLGQSGWEEIGRKQSNGTCLGNSRSWYYNMANRYGWREKVDITAEHKGQVQVQVVSYASQQSSKDTGEDIVP